MTMRSTGFMLRTDGKAEVKRDFAEVGKSGKDAFTEVATAAEEANDKAAKATEELADRQIAAFNRQANAAKVAAAAAANRSSIDAAVSTPTSQQFATVNYDRSTGAARQSAGVFEEAFAAEDRRAASLAKIKALLDPVSVAQARYDGELKTYGDLLRTGELNEREHAQAVAISTARLQDAKNALNDHGQAVMFNRTQQMMLRSAAFNASSSIAAGMPIYRVLMEQGLEVGQALAMGDNSVAGSMAKIGAASGDSAEAVKAGSDKTGGAFDALKEKGKETAKSFADEHGVTGSMQKVMSVLTPTRLAVGATAAAVLIGAKAWLDYSSSVAKMNAISIGSGALIGMTGDALEASAAAAAEAGNISVAAAREITTAYVQTGDISGDVLTGLTALTQDFASATGQDAAGAAKTLGAAFADPVAGSQMLAEKFGALSQAQVEHIAKLVEQNDLYGAQRYQLEQLGPAFAGAADQANVLARGWDRIGQAASGAWEWMGKALDRMASGGSLADQISTLEKQRDTARPSIGQLLTGTTADSLRAGYQKQIDDLRARMRQEAARSERQAEVGAAAQGAAIVGRYTGSNELDGYRTIAGKLRAALATKSQLDPDARRDMTATLDAYTHAIDTFIPRQEKANQLAEIDAKIAATKSPARKAELTVERTRIELAGQVVTKADAEAQATSRGDRARAQAGSGRDRHAESLAREAASMEVSARAALDVADAYLKSSAAGVEAEARRKAATDATRKGIDVDAQARRQLNLQLAEGAAAGARSVATLNDETAARAKVRAAVAAGTITVDQMNDALADENALRPLIAMRDAAEGATKAKLTAVIEAYTAALAAAHAEEAKSGFDKSMSDSISRVEELRAQIEDLAHSPLDAVLNAASRTANREADAMKLPVGGTDRVAFVRQKVAEAEQQWMTERARYTRGALDDQRDQLALAERELGLIGANEDLRTSELDQLRLKLALARRGVDLTSAEGRTLLANQALLDANNARLKVTAAAIDEARQFGAQFVDTVLSEDTWSSWGNAGKAILGEIKAEFVKLALLNPLKNLINGNSALPTLTSVFSSLGGLFGGKPTVPVGKNASGTENWSGGLTWVAENGPELINLPGGTRITPAAQTRQLLAANDTAARGGDVHFYDLSGAVVYEDLMAKLEARSQQASVSGAMGGAALAKVQRARSAKRTMR